MMNRPPLLRTANSLTVIIENKSHTIDRSHPSWSSVNKAIKAEEWDSLLELLDVRAAVARWTDGAYTITDDEVTYKGERLPPIIEERVLAFLQEGIDFKYLLRFHERLDANPSKRAVDELYTFLEHKNIPIGGDGCFYAYKAIRNDWMDKYSGTIDNSIGSEPYMVRNKVDDNKDRHCSAGLHVGSLQYVKWYGGSNCRVVIVKVDPADVVSVPVDHSCQKVRTCRYQVVSEYDGPLPETIYGVERPKWVEEDWEDEAWTLVEKYCLDCDDWYEVDASEDECPECGAEL